MFNLCVPVQIAIINYLAFFQDPRASRRRRYCLFRLAHEGAYSVIGKEKAERKKEKRERVSAPGGKEQTKPIVR